MLRPRSTAPPSTNLGKRFGDVLYFFFLTSLDPGLELYLLFVIESFPLFSSFFFIKFFIVEF